MGSEDGGGGDEGPRGLEALFADFEYQSEGKTDMQVRDLFEAFPDQVFGPALLIPAVLALSPLGAIPGVPTVIGIVLMLVAGQRMLGIRHPWIPRRLLDRGVERQRVEASIQRIRPWLRRIDRVLKPRMAFLLTGPMANLVAAVVVLLAASMPLLELVPFAVFLPAAAVALLALAVTAADGVFALAGMAAAAGTGDLLIRTFLV